MTTPEAIIVLLSQADKAFLVNDRRQGLTNLLLVFKEDITNESAWKMLHQVMGGGKPFDSFQMEITEKYFPEKISLLYEKQLDRLLKESSTPVSSAAQTTYQKPASPFNPGQGPMAHNTPTLFCVHCGSEVFAEGSFCPSCGKPIRQTSNPQPQPQGQQNSPYQAQANIPYTQTNSIPNPGQLNTPYGQSSQFQNQNYSPTNVERSTGSFWGAFFMVMISAFITTFFVGLFTGIKYSRDIDGQVMTQVIGIPIACFLSSLTVGVSKNISKKKALWAAFLAIGVQIVAADILAPSFVEDFIDYAPGAYFFSVFASLLVSLFGAWLVSRKNVKAGSQPSNPGSQAGQRYPYAQSPRDQSVPQSNTNSGFNLKNAFTFGLAGFCGSTLGTCLITGNFGIGAGIGIVTGIFGFILGGFVVPKRRK